MKKIIVFGASGDTGRYFVEYFRKIYNGDEYEIIAAGTRETDYFDQLSVPYYRVDIRDRESFGRLPHEGLYAVVDLAGLMPARMKGYDPYRYIDVNITGNLNILEFCREYHADRVLFAQSFGDIKSYAEEDPLLRVDMPRNFDFNTDHTVYVMTKNFTVDLLNNYYCRYGLKKFIFRMPTIYCYSPVDHYYVNGVIKKIAWREMIDRAIAGETIEVWGDPERRKDMVYVKDFCQMLYKALFVDRSEGFYNVGTGSGTSLMEFVHGIIDVFGEEEHKSSFVMCPDKPNSPQYIMDITSARNELGYVPEYENISWLDDFKAEMERDRM